MYPLQRRMHCVELSVWGGGRARSQTKQEMLIYKYFHIEILKIIDNK